MINSINQTATLVLTNEEIIEENSSKSINRKYKVIKRLFDIFFALLGLIALIPITVIVKLVTLLSGDTKSIFYSQTRIGKDGKEFKLYKFRSMIPNADEVLKKYLKENMKAAQEYRKYKKLTNDPRITKIGKVLRKTSLDEVPQVLNILKGDMSIIGNRPYLPREKYDMDDYYEDIIKTKPGLTGFWQCSLRSRGTFEERMKMEKYYSNNAGLKFDIGIFFKTVEMVVLKKDAK